MTLTRARRRPLGSSLTGPRHAVQSCIPDDRELHQKRRYVVDKSGRITRSSMFSPPPCHQGSSARSFSLLPGRLTPPTASLVAWVAPCRQLPSSALRACGHEHHPSTSPPAIGLPTFRRVTRRSPPTSVRSRYVPGFASGPSGPRFAATPCPSASTSDWSTVCGRTSTSKLTKLPGVRKGYFLQVSFLR